MIKNEVIQEIISKIDIIDVIGNFVQLKKRGTANYSGLCPFHNEKSPSFSVSPVKEIYKCFGCGKSGNAITFVMEHDKISYIEAMKWLANRYKVDFEEENISPENFLKKQTSDSLYILNQFVQDFYIKNLNLNDGLNLGFEYLKERGFEKSTLDEFKIGFANSNISLSQELLKNQFNKELIIQSGVVIERNGNLFDNYRDRIIFPIHNLSGKIIGFGARILNQNNTNSLPKYINTPETEIYNKSKSLYGIYFARNNIINQDECILVEGYTDVLSLHQAGIKNVVASGGTSLTIEQIKLIKKFTKNILIIYDGDNAGIKAAHRGMQLCIAEGMVVSIVLIPDNEDPDSFIKKNSPESFIQLLKNNKKDFILFELTTQYEENKNDINKLNQTIHEIAETISKIDRTEDFIKQEYYIKECSQILKIDEKKLMQLVNNFLKNKISKTNKNLQQNEAKILLEPNNKENNLNKTLQINLLNEDEIVEQHFARVLLEYGTKKINENQTVADYLLNICKNGEEINQEDYKQLIKKFSELYFQNQKPDAKTFIYFSDNTISKTATKCLYYVQQNPLDEWELKDPFDKEKSIKEEKIKVLSNYKSEKDKNKDNFYLKDMTSVENNFKLNKFKKIEKEIEKRLENLDIEDNNTKILIEAKKNIKLQILELGKKMGLNV